jgi:hypothetical protein
VSIDDILSALSGLDEPPAPRPGGARIRLEPPVSRRTPSAACRRLTRRYLERHVFRPPGVYADARVA